MLDSQKNGIIWDEPPSITSLGQGKLYLETLSQVWLLAITNDT